MMPLTAGQRYTRLLEILPPELRVPRREYWRYRDEYISMPFEDAFMVALNWSIYYTKMAHGFMVTTEHNQPFYTDRMVELDKVQPTSILHFIHIQMMNEMGVLNDPRTGMLSVVKGRNVVNQARLCNMSISRVAEEMALGIEDESS